MADAEPSIQFEGHGSFATDTGAIFRPHGDYAAIIANKEEFARIRLDDLVSAMQEARARNESRSWSDTNWLIGFDEDPADQYEPEVDGTYSFWLDEYGRFTITYSVYRTLFEEDEEFQRLAAVIRPFAERTGPTELASYDPVAGQETAAVSVRFDPAGKTGADAIAAAHELTALHQAIREGPMTPRSAADVVRAGVVSALVGLPEGQWFDAKAAPYQLATDLQKLELAKDVAAFANTDLGGVIILGARARRDASGDVVECIREFSLDLFDAPRYREIVRDRVFPAVDGLEVRFVGDAARGVAFVLVPPQRGSKRPFLVRGVLVDERIRSNYMSLPIRDGEDTRFSDLGEIHSLISAGRAALG